MEVEANFNPEVGEDEVIRELDVFLNNDLLLYLAQFPLKPIYSELSTTNIQGVRYKPNHHKLELSFPYPPAIQAALTKEYSQQGISSNSLLGNENFQQKMTSNEIITQQENPLMVGFINNNQFFLSSIDHILQFHPIMNQKHSLVQTESFYEGTDEDFEMALREYEEGGEGGGSGGGQSSSSNAGGSGGDNVKQIQLKRKESERAQSARLQSYTYLKQQEELEPWVHLKPFPIGRTFSIFFSLV